MRFELRNIMVEEIPTEFLMLVKAQLMDIEMGYESFGVDTPEWVGDKLIQVNSEIDTKLKAEKLRKLKNLKAIRETLKTRTERRDETDKAIAALEKDLG